MELSEQLLRNIGLDIVRVTETTALASGRFLGSGEYEAAHLAATRAMHAALSTLPMDGRVVIGEDKGYEYEMLKSGEKRGQRRRPAPRCGRRPDRWHQLARSRPTGRRLRCRYLRPRYDLVP
jgi:hypothetical protein